VVHAIIANKERVSSFVDCRSGAEGGRKIELKKRGRGSCTINNKKREHILALAWLRMNGDLKNLTTRARSWSAHELPNNKYPLTLTAAARGGGRWGDEPLGRKWGMWPLKL
jgi:hypothetical protein